MAGDMETIIASKSKLMDVSPEQQSASSSRLCSICGEALGVARPDGEIESEDILPCSHVFGSICIARWLDDSPNHNCPTCRRSMIYQDCRHAVQPCEISKAPKCVEADAMPKKCILCRQDGVWEERFAALKDRQLAEERVLLGLKSFLPTALGGMCRISVESADERIEESRERLRTNVELIRRELGKHSSDPW